MTAQREIEPRPAAADDELMQRVRDGSTRDREGAFRELVRRHAGGLCSYVAPIAGSAQAEDLVQETFLRVYQERQRYRAGPASFRSWLFRIARNLALNARRKDARQRPLDDAPTPVAASPGPLEALAARGARLELGEALAGLPPAEREVLVLRYQRGLGFAELGRVLGISPAAAKQRAWRALQRLRAQMEEA